jgi:ADP-ribosylglycohydrolase
MSQQMQVAMGAIKGALIGDAAGSVMEFKFLSTLPTEADVISALALNGGGVFRLAAGQITDDGELTLSLLRALGQHHGIYIADVVANHYLSWIDSKPFDIGSATSSALYVHKEQRVIEGLANAFQKRALQFNMDSKANGCLMRATPLGVAAFHMTPENTIKMVKTDVRMTHPNADCQDSTVAYVLAIRHLMLHPQDYLGAVKIAREYLVNTNQEVNGWLESAIDGVLPKGFPQEGYIKIAFSYAFYHLAQNSSFENALKNTLMKGGDTDTNACIVGGLIGALCGVDQIPTAQLQKIMLCDTKLGAKPRSENFHPKQVDACLHFIPLKD